MSVFYSQVSVNKQAAWGGCRQHRLPDFLFIYFLGGESVSVFAKRRTLRLSVGAPGSMWQTDESWSVPELHDRLCRRQPGEAQREVGQKGRTRCARTPVCFARKRIFFFGMFFFFFFSSRWCHLICCHFSLFGRKAGTKRLVPNLTE